MKSSKPASTVLAALLLVGCATTAQYKPIATPDTPSEKPAMAGAYWNQGTIASWKIGKDDAVHVCLDHACKHPAPENVRAFLQSRGLTVAPDEQNARYKMVMRAFVTQTLARNSEERTLPLPAWPLIGNEAAADATELRPWLDTGLSANPAEAAARLGETGRKTFAALSNDFVIYDSLNHQTGQLAQTIGGGSPAAYLAGFLLMPIVEAIARKKTVDETREGLAGVEFYTLPMGKGFSTVRTTYGFAASERPDHPRKLIEAAIDQALEGMREYAELPSGDEKIAQAEAARLAAQGSGTQGGVQ